MGWWSACILGGDTPYDAHGFIWGKALELSNSDIQYDDLETAFEHDCDLLRQILSESTIRVLFDDILTRGYTKSIYSQVLALMIIESGAALPNDIRQNLLTEISKDDWAEKDGERALYITDLLHRVEHYQDGEKHKIPQTGLFESMFSFKDGAAGQLSNAQHRYESS